MPSQELSDSTGILYSTLGTYKKDENIDISLGTLLTLSDFYHASTDFLLFQTELREHKNQSVSETTMNSNTD